MKPLHTYHVNSEQDFKDLRWYIDAEIDQWYSYVHYGLINQIQNHTGKDQRTYQRKFCSWLARLNTFKSSYPEFLI